LRSAVFAVIFSLTLASIPVEAVAQIRAIKIITVPNGALSSGFSTPLSLMPLSVVATPTIKHGALGVGPALYWICAGISTLALAVFIAARRLKK